MTISKPDCRWIYEQYRDKIFGYVSSRIHNRAEAEDVVSTIFLKICKNIDKYNPEKASLSTWVYTITCNTVYDSLKALRDRPAFELLREYAFSGKRRGEGAFGRIARRVGVRARKIAAKRTRCGYFVILSETRQKNRCRRTRHYVRATEISAR